MSETLTIKHDIGTDGGTYNEPVAHVDRIAEVKSMLAGWYVAKTGGKPFRVEAGASGAVMRTWHGGDDHGLTNVEEAIGMILIGHWIRVFEDGEREALTAKVMG